MCDSSRSTEERVSFKLICTFIFSIFSSLHYGLSIHNASRTYIVPYITMCLSIVYYLIMLKFIIRYITLCIFGFFFISVQWFNKLYNSPFHNTVSIHYPLFYFVYPLFITKCKFIVSYYKHCLFIVYQYMYNTVNSKSTL